MAISKAILKFPNEDSVFEFIDKYLIKTAIGDILVDDNAPAAKKEAAGKILLFIMDDYNESWESVTDAIRIIEPARNPGDTYLSMFSLFPRPPKKSKENVRGFDTKITNTAEQQNVKVPKNRKATRKNISPTQPFPSPNWMDADITGIATNYVHSAQGFGDPPQQTKIYWAQEDHNMATKMLAFPLGIEHPLGQASGSKDKISGASQQGMHKLYTGKDSVIAGHLLNNNMGGPATVVNLAPIPDKANKEHVRLVETPVKNLVHEHYSWVWYYVEAEHEKLPGSLKCKDTEDYYVENLICYWGQLSYNATTDELEPIVGTKNKVTIGITPPDATAFAITPALDPNNNATIDLNTHTVDDLAYDQMILKDAAGVKPTLDASKGVLKKVVEVEIDLLDSELSVQERQAKLEEKEKLINIISKVNDIYGEISKSLDSLLTQEEFGAIAKLDSLSADYSGTENQKLGEKIQEQILDKLKVLKNDPNKLEKLVVSLKTHLDTTSLKDVTITADKDKQVLTDFIKQLTIGALDMKTENVAYFLAKKLDTVEADKNKQITGMKRNLDKSKLEVYIAIINLRLSDVSRDIISIAFSKLTDFEKERLGDKKKIDELSEEELKKLKQTIEEEIKQASEEVGEPANKRARSTSPTPNNS